MTKYMVVSGTDAYRAALEADVPFGGRSMLNREDDAVATALADPETLERLATTVLTRDSEERVARLERLLLKLALLREAAGGRELSEILGSNDELRDEDDDWREEATHEDPTPRRHFDTDDEWHQWLAAQHSGAAAEDPRSRRRSGLDPVELRELSTRGVVVRLAPAVERDLNVLALESRPRVLEHPRDDFERGSYAPGHESCGYLFGRIVRDNVVEIESVIGAGPNAVREADSVTYEAGDPPAAAFESELRDVFDVRNIRLVGRCHTHPISGDGRPSDGDLRSWGRLLDRLEEERGATQLVFLIGTMEGGDSGGVFRAAWHPWVVQRSATGSLVCEPASLGGN